MHVVDGGRLGGTEEGQRLVRPRSSAHSSEASSTVDAPSVSGVELPAVMVAASPLPKTGLRVASFSTEESGPQVLVALEPAERRDQVVEEPARRTPRRGAGAKRRRARPARLATDPPLQRRSARRARPSTAACAARRSAGCRGRCRRGGSARAPSACPRVSRALLTLTSFLRSLSLIATGASEVVSVPPATPTSIWPSAILLATWIVACRPVPHACWMSVAGRLGRQLGAEHALAGQVEVAGVLEHGAGDHLAEPLALEPEPGRPGRRAPP